MGLPEGCVVFFKEENSRIESSSVGSGIGYEIPVTVDISVAIIGRACEYLKDFGGWILGEIEYILFCERFCIHLFDDILRIGSEEENSIIGIVILIDSAVLHEDSRDGTDGESEDDDSDEDRNECFSSFWFCEMKHIEYNVSKDVPIISKTPRKKNEK